MVFQLNAQTPFDCNGRIYRVVEQRGGTVLQELNIDPAGRKLDIMDLQFYRDVQINGIAYHPSQNLIYGVLLGENYRLCRIDGDHRLSTLRDLPLPEDILFVSGDVSPDERYLVLLGYSRDQSTNLAALIDLTDPAYPTEIIRLTTTSPVQRQVYCADIAFHPTTDQLFGFDDLSDRLVTIDLEERKIDNTFYPATDQLRGNVPSIFFDAEGALFGIGSPENGLVPRRNLYHFDVVSGEVDLREERSYEDNQDACSCPFRLKLLNRVSSRSAPTCTELTFTFTLINRTNRPQEGLTLTDTFPTYTEIGEIEPLPFPGEVIREENRPILHIRNITLPVGNFSFAVKLRIRRDAPHTTVYNTAYLDGIQGTETARLPSDDPDTHQANDPTFFAIRPLHIDPLQEELLICPDSTITLRADLASSGLDYHWSTGAVTPAITVADPGLYRLTVTSGCEQAVGDFRVAYDRVSVELGPEQDLERGQPLTLQAAAQSHSPIISYEWTAISGTPPDCADCPDPVIRPLSDTRIHLRVVNEHGCPASDILQLRVRDFGLFAPTAFSPNGDQINDVFYLQSRAPYNFQYFRIFDRWGSLVFQAREGTTNSVEASWDGSSRGRMMRAGVYIWTAEITNLAGQVLQTSGELNLIR
ncbi:hypothetical protein CRP01_38105 [Flavilitoribacter nigricans DSM 23189 = NBRC 102662]|uniref:DUF6923 domain-containing protein n=2 Tax=Flavilitoribacter TaxID=2762562 RepID=A0A2D0MY79_FLAN2|nr:hypothetical protein CRP01_38105 [Flavilitoribacter nigricans DSM 23189 = NBRC 102662]